MSGAEGALTGRLVSLQVGRPQVATTAAGKVWESAIFKQPVETRLALGRTNLDGDAQANRKHHGGPDKAVCCYSAEHYPAWKEELSLNLPFGAFGENFTWEGLTEDRVCIGDVFTVGSAAVQVTQPRQPCANISRRWECAPLPGRMEETGHTGCYLRVIEEGEVGSGDAVLLTDRPHPDWTLLRANYAMYDRAPERDELEALAALSAEWKRILSRRIASLEG